MAMYKAKEEGKSGLAFFTEDMDREAKNILIMKNRLHKALDREEFLLYYPADIQPCESSKLVGLEALLRWKDPEDGIIPPAKFMPVLEELGMIKEVGRWVMEQAFKKSKEWGERYGAYISVNVSPRQFSDRKFVSNVFELAGKTKTQPHLLILEITEASLMRNPEESVDILKRLKAKGFRVAVDDSGTGYSSHLYLRKLPLT
ncbi:MAG: EAL domain-containing protein [Aquificota bacterium]|nr:EAL domain-containing protein [Aquificota bacterium]